MHTRPLSAALPLLPLPTATTAAAGVKRKHASASTATSGASALLSPKVLIEKPPARQPPPQQQQQPQQQQLQQQRIAAGALGATMPVRASVLPAAEYRFNVSETDQQLIETGVKTLEIRCSSHSRTRLLLRAPLLVCRVAQGASMFAGAMMQTQRTAVRDHPRERPHPHQRTHDCDRQRSSQVLALARGAADGAACQAASDCRERVRSDQHVGCSDAALSPVPERRRGRDARPRGARAQRKRWCTSCSAAEVVARVESYVLRCLSEDVVRNETSEVALMQTVASCAELLYEQLEKKRTYGCSLGDLQFAFPALPVDQLLSMLTDVRGTRAVRVVECEREREGVATDEASWLSSSKWTASCTRCRTSTSCCDSQRERETRENARIHDDKTLRALA